MLVVKNAQNARNFLITMGALFAGDHGDDDCNMQKDALRNLFSVDAVEAFNEVLAMEQEDNVLSLLHSFGWREDCPDPEYWSFTNDQFPGVIIYWPHGHSRGYAR